EIDRDLVLSGLTELLKNFANMRENEGKVLLKVLTEQLQRIESLISQARKIDLERSEARRVSLKSALNRVMEAAPEISENRLEQELALIAVKADISEELDRLDAHVAAARQMLQSGDPVGRKLDFLSQEFNREANTLCAKAQYAPLTQIGLDLKAVIDQLREQVQNVE
ncbi:MAG: endoribonuclease YicC domain-containing protein, partial [Mangrovicoccus sp.]